MSKNVKVCVICKESFDSWGHNPVPVFKSGLACTDCFINLVVPVRLSNLSVEQITKLQNKLREGEKE